MAELPESELMFASLTWDTQSGDLRQDLLDAVKELAAANAKWHRYRRSRKTDLDAHLDAHESYEALESIIDPLVEDMFAGSEQRKWAFREMVEKEWARFPSLIPLLSRHAVERERMILECSVRIAWGFKSHEHRTLERALKRTPEWKVFSGKDEKKRKRALIRDFLGPKEKPEKARAKKEAVLNFLGTGPDPKEEAARKKANLDFLKR